MYKVYYILYQVHINEELEFWLLRSASRGASVNLIASYLDNKKVQINTTEREILVGVQQGFTSDVEFVLRL